MDKRIGVGLNSFYSVILGAVCTTILAFAVHPSVLASYMAQVALHVTENGTDTVLAVGLLGTVERTAAHLGGEVGARDSKNLLCHDVVDALLQVGNLLFETCQQTLGNLAQEDPALAAGVEKSRFGTAEQLLRQKVEHTIGQLGRGEDLVAGKVGQAIEDVWTIVCHIDKVGYNAKGDKCVQVRRSFVPRLARRRGCIGGFG